MTTVEPLKHNPPLFDGNCFTRFFLMHLNKVCDLGGSRPFQMSDLFEVAGDFVHLGYSNFKRSYTEQLAKKPNRSFFTITMVSIKAYLLPGGILFFFVNAIQVLTPIFIRLFLDWLQAPNAEVWKGYVYAAILSTVLIFRAFFSQHAMQYLHSGTAVVNNYVGSLVAEKISNLPPGARKFVNVGKITNFLTSDVRSLQGAGMTVHQLFVTPLLLLIYTGMIIGVTKWVGLLVPAVIIICVPLQTKINGMFMNQNKVRMGLADQRAKLVNQIITGVKNIKFNAWENVMFEKADEIRQKEKSLVVAGFVLKGLGDAFAKMIPTFCTIVVIWVYNSVYDVPLTVGETFYIITLFNLFLTPINVLLFALINVATASVSARRIKELSLIKDVDLQPDDANLPKGAIQFEDASFGWTDLFYQKIFEPDKKIDEASFQGENAMILKHLSVRIEPGSFVVVVGKVGSGKSSFLLACLNEMVAMGGAVRKNGSIAFIPQEAFLLNDTVKNNILFGRTFDEPLYRKAIELSQLQQDLRELPGGEQTEIGERGINLSGGQKQRVLIARAIYAEADINLIDDSLSALDAYVGKKVFEGVFCGSMAGKTRVMVTHHLHLLDDSRIDNILFIDKGSVVCQGKYHDIQNHPSFIEYCSEAKKKEDQKAEEEAKKKEEEKKKLAVEEKSGALQSEKPSGDLESKNKLEAQVPTARIDGPQPNNKQLSKEDIQVDSPSLGAKKSSVRDDVKPEDKDTDENKAAKGKLTKNEVRFEGQVPFRIYIRYLASGNMLVGILALLVFLANGLLVQFSNYWAGKWAQHGNYYGVDTDNEYGYVYLVIMGLIFLTLILRAWLFGIFSSKSSYTLFREMIYNVLRRPMSFFDTTPNGIIMNRCNDDVYQVDFMVPSTMSFFLDSLTTFVIAIVLIVLVLPYILILVAIFAVMLYFIMRKYMRTAVELRRLTQLSVSPLLNKVSETIGGVVSIRAFKKVEWMREKYANALDRYTLTQLHERMSAVWVNFRLEIMVGVVAGICPFMIAVIKTQNWNLTSTKGNTVVYGTILTNVFLLGNLMGFFIFSFSEVAKGMNSVQRIIEYIEYKIHERAWETPKAPTNWPVKGEINIRNLTLRYRKGLPLVIRGLDFDISTHQKVGIVGRTGSGKSTVLLSLMRILEMEEDANGKPVGSINIDGVQIDQIGLHELRKNLTVIPQDPFLIQGSLRFNIDPQNQYQDEDILENLRKVQILDSIRTEDIINQKIKAYKAKKNGPAAGPGGPPMGRPAAPKKEEIDDKDDPEIQKIRSTVITDTEKLEFAIDAGGSNLSVGQRQLICIARSLIRKPKILLMDEATANIDQKTDSIIQRVIKNNMNDTTVITIAHRLVTIVQYDKILILENGKKKEEGSPLELLQSRGYFHKLVSEGGQDFEQKMVRLATDRTLDPTSI
jgi:ATP-binding cassette subfamily C (CFTR/MRP) protein 1